MGALPKAGRAGVVDAFPNAEEVEDSDDDDDVEEEVDEDVGTPGNRSVAATSAPEVEEALDFGVNCLRVD